MSEPDTIEIINEVIAEETAILDEVMAELEKELADFGSPEKLLGMPYEMWANNPAVISALQAVYGTANDSRLAKLIAQKEYEKVLELEKALQGGK